jgi:copper chaperone
VGEPEQGFGGRSHVGEIPGRGIFVTTTFVEETTMATSTYTVSGMTCGHCVNAVTSEISELEGVTDVQVDLASGAVTVTSAAPLDDAAVAAAVDEAGYEVVS